MGRRLPSPCRNNNDPKKTPDLLRREDMHLYAWNGNVPEMEMVEWQAEVAEGSTQLRAKFKDGIERTLFAVELEGYPGIYLVSAASDTWILHDWIRMSLMLGAIGSASSVLLFNNRRA